MIVRRIKRRMGILGIPGMTEFRQRLEASPESCKDLADDFLVGVTEFFREPKSWTVLAESILPGLFKCNEGRSVRAWVPACASGEEAYSLAMLLSELAPSPEARARIEIFATDLDRQALDRARAGIYGQSAAHAVPPERLKRFFVQSGESFQVGKDLRSLVMFSPHNLLGDPPFSRMDIVSCRNLLIYLKPAMQERLAALFSFSLSEGGYLLLGRSENLPGGQEWFEEVSAPARIFKRRHGVPHVANLHLPAVPAEKGRGYEGLTRTRPQETARLVNNALLARFTPAAVLADQAFQVLYFHGNVEPYLHRASGAPTDNLLEIARNGLSARVKAIFHQAVDQDRMASVDAEMVHEDQRVTVRIMVTPLTAAHGSRPLYLTTFETLSRAPVSRKMVTGARRSRSSLIEQELSQARQEMQTIIQDLRNTNEELKISNEESLSANEELQAANEELASSKEEMQSLNEEMSAVNTQLESKLGELQTANDDLHNFLQNSRIACLFLDRQMRIKRYTAPITELFTLLPSDVGRPIANFASTFVNRELIDAAARVLEDLNSRETEIRTSEGKWYWRSIQPYETADNHIDGVVVTYTDITGLKKAEEGVRRLATVMQDSNDAVTAHDFDGHILIWNGAAERMYGYSAIEAQATNILSVVPPARGEEYLAMIERARKHEQIPSFETQRLTRDGRTLDIWLTASVLRDDEGKPYAVATTERDISDRLRTEQQLRYRAMRLQEADRRRTEFLAMLAHELRNPLAPVRNAVELMKQGNLTTEQIGWATRLMDRQTSHLTRLIDDLLDVSRITAGKVRLQRERLDARDVIRDAVEASDSLLQTRGHRLSMDLPQEPLWVFADPARLQQVMGNLLTNAFKYTERGGKVLVKATLDDLEITICVTDSGVGIAQDLLPHIFELFIQGDQTLDRSQGGLGIGLTLVQQLVQMHGGAVEAHSEGAGRGSEFVIRLPAMAAAESAAEPETPPPKAESEPKPRRVLIVDDNADFAESMKMLLELEGHEVKVVHDGKSAIKAARAFVPDVVLLDLGLPGMNGYETAQRLRTMVETREATLIAISGYAQEEDRQTSVLAGFDGHLKKPVEIPQVLEVIQAR